MSAVNISAANVSMAVMNAMGARLKSRIPALL